jgi:hypothetical protein
MLLPSAMALAIAGEGVRVDPDGSGVYTACLLKNVGTIRLIDPTIASVEPHESLLMWFHHPPRRLTDSTDDTSGSLAALADGEAD